MLQQTPHLTLILTTHPLLTLDSSSPFLSFLLSLLSHRPWLPVFPCFYFFAAHFVCFSAPLQIRAESKSTRSLEYREHRGTQILKSQHAPLWPNSREEGGSGRQRTTAGLLYLIVLILKHKEWGFFFSFPPRTLFSLPKTNLSSSGDVISRLSAAACRLQMSSVCAKQSVCICIMIWVPWYLISIIQLSGKKNKENRAGALIKVTVEVEMTLACELEQRALNWQVDSRLNDWGCLVGPFGKWQNHSESVNGVWLLFSLQSAKLSLD